MKNWMQLKSSVLQVVIKPFLRSNIFDVQMIDKMMEQCPWSATTHLEISDRVFHVHKVKDEKWVLYSLLLYSSVLSTLLYMCSHAFCKEPIEMRFAFCIFMQFVILYFCISNFALHDRSDSCVLKLLIKKMW